MKILIPAIRQYKHNDGSEGFVLAYDKSETEKVVDQLRYSAHNEISKRLDLENNLDVAIKKNKNLQNEIDRLNSVLNNRKAIK
ncbi:unnamed protein product [marine sediment metagenome]|uniref:Uncharacterized protein n=1 Tax=marine sediment metagenome TaxID=412755 RepID=X0W775_9ZZZZ